MSSPRSRDSSSPSPRARVRSSSEARRGSARRLCGSEAVEAARGLGIVVLSTRPVESETTFSYSALGDLLEDVFAAVAGDIRLPSGEPSGSRSCGPRPMDRRRISTRFRWRRSECSGSLAASAPLILAIDDIQWIDPSSARVLGFAVRRLKDERVGILATARTGTAILVEFSQALDRVRVRHVTWGRCAPEGTRGAASRPSRSSPPSTARRPAPRGLGREPVLCSGDRSSSGAPGCPSGPGRTTPRCRRTSSSCSELASLRFRLPPARRSSRSPRRPGRRRISSSRWLDARTRRRPVSWRRKPRASSVEKGDRSGSRTHSSDRPSTRRPHRRRSAASTAGWRSWSSTSRSGLSHLALSTTGPDVDVAEALEGAAQHARARGAPDAAAGLGELARQLTPLEDEEGLRRRSMDAAEYHFDAGDAPRAIALLEEAAASSPPGPERAELLFRLSSMSWMNLERGVRDPLERALLEAGDDPELLAGIHLDLAWVDIYQGDLAAASEHARRSIDQSEGSSTRRPRPTPSRRSGWWSSSQEDRRTTRCPRRSNSRTSGWTGDRGPRRRSTRPRVPSSGSSRCGRGSSTRPG